MLALAGVEQHRQGLQRLVGLLVGDEPLRAVRARRHGGGVVVVAVGVEQVADRPAGGVVAAVRTGGRR